MPVNQMLLKTWKISFGDGNLIDPWKKPINWLPFGWGRYAPPDATVVLDESELRNLLAQVKPEDDVILYAHGSPQQLWAMFQDGRANKSIGPRNYREVFAPLKDKGIRSLRLNACETAKEQQFIGKDASSFAVMLSKYLPDTHIIATPKDVWFLFGAVFHTYLNGERIGHPKRLR
ncbi:MAG: hypothetical protein KTR14_05870 [Vampirovibrio sp.]|nr:hypothetical protein [Vampirovibrio sp.]